MYIIQTNKHFSSIPNFLSTLSISNIHAFENNNFAFVFLNTNFQVFDTNRYLNFSIRASKYAKQQLYIKDKVNYVCNKSWLEESSWNVARKLDGMQKRSLRAADTIIVVC